MNLKKILGIYLEHMLGNISKNIFLEECLRYPGKIFENVRNMSSLYSFELVFHKEHNGEVKFVI